MVTCPGCRGTELGVRCGEHGYRRGCRGVSCRLAKRARNAARYGAHLGRAELLPDGHLVVYRANPKTRGPQWRCGCRPLAVVQGPACPACGTGAPWR